MSNILRKFLNVDIKEDKPIFGRMELKQYLNSRTKNTKDEEKLDSEVQYYKNVLDFQSVKVRDCMVPRTEIIALEFNTSLEKLNKVFIETGHSKILIFKDFMLLRNLSSVVLISKSLLLSSFSLLILMKVLSVIVIYIISSLSMFNKVETPILCFLALRLLISLLN